MTTGKPVCAILGVGPGNGLALARRFSAAGHATALCSRDGAKMRDMAAEIDGAQGYACDVTDAGAVADTIATIRAQMGPPTTLVYNAGNAIWGTIDDLGPEALQDNFAVNALGLFHAAQAVLPDMRAAGRGTILVVGAGAALRGRPGSVAFAAAKAAQRSIAQSLARQLGPENIHVAYLILDGIVDTPRALARFPDQPESFFLTAEGVADAALMLANQERQAWSFELDLRPFGETW